MDSARAQLSRPGLLRLAAPAAVLLAVTVAVLLVRVGLDHGAPATGARSGGRVAAASGREPPAHRRRPGAARASRVSTGRTYVVQTGDTLSAIAARRGTTVAALEALNPGVDPSALQVGQTIRVK